MPRALIDRVFEDATLRGRILTCRPAADGDSACARQVIASFGRRAWRRPLNAEELDALVTLATNARALGADFEGSIAQVAKALLASVSFLYRVELDPDPRSTVANRLEA